MISISVFDEQNTDFKASKSYKCIGLFYNGFEDKMFEDYCPE